MGEALMQRAIQRLGVHRCTCCALPAAGCARCHAGDVEDLNPSLGHSTAMDKTANVVLDIESLAQSTDKCSGSPKMTRALSRKGSCRMERRCGVDEEEIDEGSKKVLLKVYSQLEPLKQPLITNKASTTATATTTATFNGPNLMDSSDGRSKRFNRFISLNPRKILLLFATMSSMGTMILIYFTLAINRKVELQSG